jgi:peptidoglycan/LPS O-acetylase OafA/YrhL
VLNPLRPVRILTPGRHFVPEIDGLRFAAIAAVVLYHLSQHTLTRHMTGAEVQSWESRLPQVFDGFRYGVQLFFVLSGFLLSLPFAKWRLGCGDRPALSRYFLRRLTRLEPPYVIAMLILFAGPPLFASWMATGWSLWPNLLGSLIYQHTLIFGELNPINPVTWSLEVEVQFYLLAPVLASVFSIRNTSVRRVLLTTIMLAIPAVRTFLPSGAAAFYNTLPWHLEYFLAGFLLADFYIVEWHEAPRRLYLWDFVSVSAWPALLIALLGQRFVWAFAPLMLLVCGGALRGRISGWIFSRPWVTAIGGMCYSIYLIHFRLLWVTGRLAMRFLWGSSFLARLSLEAAISLPAILLVSAMFFVCIERPCMNPNWPAEKARRLRLWYRRIVRRQGREVDLAS